MHQFKRIVLVAVGCLIGWLTLVSPTSSPVIRSRLPWTPPRQATQ
jgi:hypothetical protein